MLADAEENAKPLLEPRDDAAKAARGRHPGGAEAQRAGGDEAPGVRVPRLFAGDVKHLESINHIPSFRFKDTLTRSLSPLPSRAEPNRPVLPGRSPGPAPRLSRSEPKPEPEPEPEPVPQPCGGAAQNGACPPKDPRTSQEEPTLQDKVDYSREQLRQEPHSYHPDDNYFSQVGIDLEAYSEIPESLQREKASHFSNLEFGDDVDLESAGNKKGQP